jgi:predicted nucleotidyltransferase
MALSINNLLRDLSYNYYISNGSVESNKIEVSIGFLSRSIKAALGDDIIKIVKFGSYDRDTMLPRLYDSNSDVDIMIVFNHDSCGVKAETYRNWIRKFTELKYPRSYVKKDFPTLVLELDHIKFDLVPTISLMQKYYIPDNNNGWMNTDPEGFNKHLTESNRRYNSIVKPIIRLLKAWNSSKGKPYSSYELEKFITVMNFQGHTIESGFFYAIDKIPTTDLSKTALTKVQHLKDDKNWVVTYLNQGDGKNSLIRLKRILPF